MDTSKMPSNISFNGGAHVRWLMIPRVEIIADWFGRTDRMPIGHIVLLNTYKPDNGWYHRYTYDEPFHLEESQIDQYSAIVSRLGWWQRRSLEDMPAYLKKTGMVNSSGEPIPDMVIRVKKHFNAGNGEWRHNSFDIFCTDDLDFPFNTCVNYMDYLPATRAEWEEQKNKKTII